MNTTTLNIGNLNHIADLFRCFNSGKHLNRVADPALWAELESGIDTYRGLFGSLGYELKFDERGFAWFHSEDPSSNLTKRSRSLALLFMVIFDYQADEGKPLIRFGDWRLDRELLSKIFNQYNELLMAADIGNLESEMSSPRLRKLGTSSRLEVVRRTWRVLSPTPVVSMVKTRTAPLLSRP